MKIIVAEDEPILVRAIDMMLEKLGHEVIGIIDNSEEFLNTWTATQPDLAILDIKIEGNKNGIELAQIISQSQKPIPIIFITSLKSDKVFEQVKYTKPFAFMPKPFDELALSRNIELALDQYKNHTWEEAENINPIPQTSSPHFFVNNNNVFKKIDCQDIYYIHVAGKYSEIITKDKSYEVRMSLKELMQKLPAQDFLRTHRNYIININYISSIEIKKNYLIIENTQIPISQTYKEQLHIKLNLLR